MLEDSGFGSSAAALTVRCMFEKLGNLSAFPAVNPSDPLNRNQTRAAILPRLAEVDQECLHVVDQQIYDAAFGVRKNASVE